MSEPSQHFITCPDASGGHRMAYWQWGAADAAHAVVCVHGLTRQGRDFDVLAQALVARADHPLRVICPDIAGRGASDWLKNPMAYSVPSYAADCLTLLLQLKAPVLDWVGTSMGGLIGLAMAGQAATAAGVPVRKLVLNDVGPELEWASLQRIGSYIGTHMRFDSIAQAIASLRETFQGFGPHTPQQWEALNRAMLRSAPDGGVQLHYDPAIAQAFRDTTPQEWQQGSQVLWALYDALRAPTLVLRGAESDLLSAATAAQMIQRGPRATLREFAGVGHAPTLIADDQVDAVASFLLP